MSWHGGTRAPLSKMLYTFSRRYVMAWSNVEADMSINGEGWIIEALAKHAPVKAGVFFDVGANQGAWSALVLAHVPDARLIAFEPVPPVRAELSHNLAGRDVEILPFALSNEAGPITINFTPENPHLSSLEAVEESVRIAVQTVEVQRSFGDQICAERGISHIRFLKVDTEGHDLKVLEGFRNMIDSSAVDVIQFEYNYMSIYSRTFLRDFFTALTPAMRIGRLLRNRVEFFDYAPQMDNFIQANFIAVRTELAKGELAFLSS